MTDKHEALDQLLSVIEANDHMIDTPEDIAEMILDNHDEFLGILENYVVED